MSENVKIAFNWSWLGYNYYISKATYQILFGKNTICFDTFWSKYHYKRLSDINCSSYINIFSHTWCNWYHSLFIFTKRLLGMLPFTEKILQKLWRERLILCCNKKILVIFVIWSLNTKLNNRNQLRAD